MVKQFPFVELRIIGKKSPYSNILG